MSNSLDYAHKYYIDGEDEYCDKKSVWYYITETMNWISAIAFILAIIFSVYFITLNLEQTQKKLKKINDY